MSMNLIKKRHFLIHCIILSNRRVSILRHSHKFRFVPIADQLILLPPLYVELLASKNKNIAKLIDEFILRYHEPQLCLTYPVNGFVIQQSIESKCPVIRNRGIAIRSLPVFCNVSGLIVKFTSFGGNFGFGLY